MIKDVMIAVQQKLDGVAELKYAGEDWGQLDNYGDHPPLDFPCALFDISDVEYSDHSLHSQEATAIMNVRVADYRPTFETGVDSGEGVFSYFDVVTAVYGAIQGLSGETFSSLSRQVMTKTKRTDGIREFVMEFLFTFTDNSAIKKLYNVKVPVDLKVKRKVIITPGD